MLSDRVSFLKRAIKAGENDNKRYNETLVELEDSRTKRDRALQIMQNIRLLDSLVVKTETAWRDDILAYLESQIDNDLAFVYPDDGYSIKLSARPLRGHIHIETKVSSCATDVIRGNVDDSQGRLFQEIMAFSGLVAIMKLLGVNTVYLDEGFSGASPENFGKLAKLLSSEKAKGLNLVVIFQNYFLEEDNMNMLYLNRSLDNKTTVIQTKGVEVCRKETDS